MKASFQPGGGWPRQAYARLRLRFTKGKIMSEVEVRHLLARWGFELHQVDYHMSGSGVFEYTMVVSTIDGSKMQKMADPLRRMPSILEFRISPTGD